MASRSAASAGEMLMCLLIRRSPFVYSSERHPQHRCGISTHCWNTGGGPLIRFHFKLTFTSTRLAILMKGMPLVMP